MLKRLTLAMSIALISTPFIVACDDNNDNSSHVEKMQYKTVVDAALATPDLSILVEALTAADLVDTLSLTDGVAPFTVFAPTNEAFAKLLTATGLTKEQLLADTSLLTSVLTYHVVPHSKISAGHIPLGKPIQSVNGGAFIVNKDANNKLSVLDAKGNQSFITVTDIQTANGVVHVIDDVILPADKNIVEVAQANENFSILVEAVVAADLASTLSTTPNVTVFAPTNDAFVALLGELGLTKAQLLADKALLTKVLTYHVVPDLVYSSEVAAGSVMTLQGSDFSFGSDAKITDSRDRVANLTATDIQGSNGVIHVIDKVILPAQ